MKTIQFIGCDVSAKSLQMAQQKENSWHYTSLKNTWENIQEYIQILVKEQDMKSIVYHFIIEATGTYSSKIIYALCEAKVNVTVISPKQSHAFGKMKNITIKNDKADAQLLAQYGLLNASELKIYAYPSDKNLELKAYLELLEQLEKSKRQFLNRLDAYQQLPPKQQKKLVLKTYEANINQYNTQIAEIETEISKLSPKKSDIQDTKSLIKSVVGLGEKSALALIGYTGGFENFENAKQLSKFIGLSPTQYQSGTSVKGRGHINSSGNGTIRSTIYVASWSAIRFNKACKALYERLRSKGKPKKVCLIAVCNLLIRQAFAVVKNKCKFDNSFFEKNLSDSKTF